MFICLLKLINTIKKDSRNCKRQNYKARCEVLNLVDIFLLVTCRSAYQWTRSEKLSTVMKYIKNSLISVVRKGYVDYLYETAVLWELVMCK